MEESTRNKWRAEMPSHYTALDEFLAWTCLVLAFGVAGAAVTTVWMVAALVFGT